MGHIAADTAKWVPKAHPFDKDIARRISMRAGELEHQTSLASTKAIRTSVHETAVAFESVARAMTVKNRKGVERTTVRLRATYKQLKVLCALEY